MESTHAGTPPCRQQCCSKNLGEHEPLVKSITWFSKAPHTTSGPLSPLCVCHLLAPLHNSGSQLCGRVLPEPCNLSGHMANRSGPLQHCQVTTACCIPACSCIPRAAVCLHPLPYCSTARSPRQIFAQELQDVGLELRHDVDVLLLLMYYG